jgi:uncharacterized protein
LEKSCGVRSGRPEIVAFLTGKWARELDYRLIKELWGVTDNHESSGRWHGKAVGFKAW